MRADLKSAAILLATLALGVILGMVGEGMLMRQRTQQVSELRRPPGFVDHMERIIQPTDAQRDTVRALLTLAARQNQATIQGARDSLRSAIVGLQEQLAPLLDAEQRERLAEMSRLPDPFRPPPPGAGGKGPGAGGPPPGGPPPGGPPPGGSSPGGPPRDSARPGGPPGGAPPRDGPSQGGAPSGS